MARFFRFLGIGFLALVVLAIAVGIVGWFWLKTSLPQTEGAVETAAVGADTEIIRDDNGVPHIFAKSAEDAYAALGYVHAQDRLWQMETMRRLGAGRLSEIFGSATVHVDRYSRTFSLYRLAEIQVERMTDDERAVLDSYARGVNAYLETHRGALPPEFVLLRHRPEPWQPADSLVWAKIMAMKLSMNWRRELLRWRLSKRLTPTEIRELWLNHDVDVPVAISDRLRASLLPLDRLALAVPDAFSSLDASNAWVLDGRLTGTGKPILANDPHLALDAPVIWYLVHMQAPGLSLTGATAPGVPLLILGHNGHIAWGMTTTGGDVEDLFIEDIDPENPDRYLTPKGPMEFGYREEVINVRNADPVTVRIRETRHGPVISDILQDDDTENPAFASKHVIALATTVLDPEDDTARALLKINRATDWTSFLEATRDFGTPQQNLFFADTAGDIGLIAPARIPIRRSGDGFMPVSGADGKHDWTGIIPFEELPRTHNPPIGYIANANNQLVDDSYPHFITGDWDSSWRGKRLEEALYGTSGHTLDDSSKLLMDNLSTAARRVTPLLLAAPANSARAERAKALLGKWDYKMERDRPEPLIYATWLKELMKEITSEKLGPMLRDFRRVSADFVIAVLTRNQHWCTGGDKDKATTESCNERIATALDKALAHIAQTQGDDIAAWRWGAAHRATFVHQLFSRIPVIDRLTETGIETDGGDYTLNRGQTAGFGEDPHRHVHGSGYRGVYDLSNLAQSRFTIATGQSGNPLSPHYRDQLIRWRDGGSFQIATTIEAARARATRTLVLRPAAR